MKEFKTTMEGETEDSPQETFNGTVASGALF